MHVYLSVATCHLTSTLWPEFDGAQDRARFIAVAEMAPPPRRPHFSRRMRPDTAMPAETLRPALPSTPSEAFQTDYRAIFGSPPKSARSAKRPTAGGGSAFLIRMSSGRAMRLAKSRAALARGPEASRAKAFSKAYREVFGPTAQQPQPSRAVMDVRPRCCPLAPARLVPCTRPPRSALAGPSPRWYCAELAKPPPRSP